MYIYFPNRWVYTAYIIALSVTFEVRHRWDTNKFIMLIIVNRGHLYKEYSLRHPD